jgi:hypothetical protein
MRSAKGLLLVCSQLKGKARPDSVELFARPVTCAAVYSSTRGLLYSIFLTEQLKGQSAVRLLQCAMSLPIIGLPLPGNLFYY